MRIIAFIILCGSIFFSGCATGYSAQAVRKAREYALEKYPDLSESAVHWIRFTIPKIEQNIVTTRTTEYSNRPFGQTCMVWDIPEYDGTSLVVVGFSDKKLRHWYPIRAIFKRFRVIKGVKEEKTGSASKDKKKKPGFTLDAGNRSMNKK